MKKDRGITARILVAVCHAFLPLLVTTTCAAGSGLPEVCPGFRHENDAQVQVRQLGYCLEKQSLSRADRLVALKTRAMLSLQLNLPRQALRDFGTALQLSPADPECYFGLAIAYKRLGNEQESLTNYLIAKKLRESPIALRTSPPRIAADKHKTRTQGDNRLPVIPRISPAGKVKRAAH